MYQLNFEITKAGAEMATIPAFARSVTRMHLNNSDYYIADYVPTSEDVVAAS